MFSYLSYRDPNLLKTLEVYDETARFLRELELDDDALTKAIIGTIGDVDAYQLPDAKGYSRYVSLCLCWCSCAAQINQQLMVQINQQLMICLTIGGFDRNIYSDQRW